MKNLKYIYMAGTYLRNKKIFDCYQKLKISEKWDIDTLMSQQLVKLRGLVQYAFDNSSFYRDKFIKNQFHPDQLMSLEDVSLIPTTSKEEVLQHSNEIQIKDCGEKLFFSETSGSTGRPLVFYRNQEWDAWHNASVLRGYSWHNVQPWERNGYLWGYNIAPNKMRKIKLLDMLQNRFRLFSYKDAEIEEFVTKLKSAQYLEGYSSMLYEVAKRVNAKNTAHKFNLKLIKGTSEKIYDAYQFEVEKAFGKKIVSEYGSAEGGIIAFECASGNMHINMETVIVEVIDGEIVVTNLVSKSFPIIRYKLGDYITLENCEKCSCGMVHPIIIEVTGRVGAVIKGKTNDYPSLTLYYVFKNLALEKGLILNYQAIQDNKGQLVVHIESLLQNHERDLLMKEFSKYFQSDLDVELIEGSKRQDFTAKKKDFITNLK